MQGLQEHIPFSCDQQIRETSYFVLYARLWADTYFVSESYIFLNWNPGNDWYFSRITLHFFCNYISFAVGLLIENTITPNSVLSLWNYYLRHMVLFPAFPEVILSNFPLILSVTQETDNYLPVL